VPYRRKKLTFVISSPDEFLLANVIIVLSRCGLSTCIKVLID